MDIAVLHPIKSHEAIFSSEPEIAFVILSHRVQRFMGQAVPGMPLAMNQVARVLLKVDRPSRWLQLEVREYNKCDPENRALDDKRDAPEDSRKRLDRLP